MHSFSKNPKQTGSYLRAARDILRVVKKLPLDSTDIRLQFLIYYAMCEKLAAAMHGVSKRKPIGDIYKSGYKVKVKKLVSACQDIGFSYPEADIVLLFDEKSAGSARRLRNDFLHRPGPNHLKAITQQASASVPRMKDFLRGIEVLSEYIYAMP